MLRDDMAQEQVQMHSALETAAVVDIRTVLQQLGQQQLTALCVMRVDLHQAKVTFHLQTALHAMLVATVQRVGSRLHAVVTVG